MYILGLNCYYHDSAACLIKDGKIIAALEEERLNREKHTKKFPINSIKYCLKKANISMNDIDYIGFYIKPSLRLRLLPIFLKGLPKSLLGLKHAINTTNFLKIKKELKINFNLNKNTKFFFIEHHLAHAASSFFVSPFKESAILSIDGVGEVCTTWYGIGQDNKLKAIKKINFPHSLGFVYSAVTQYLGFKEDSDEYKVMGLAAYGKPKYYEEFKDIIQLKKNGEFKINLKYFDYQYGKKPYFSKKFISLFGPNREKEGEIKDIHKDLASSLQKRFEDVLLNMLNYLYNITNSKNLCLVGGCALNSVANGKILKNTPFKNIYIQAAANDAGTSLGSAYYIYNYILNRPRNYIMNSAYLGPEFSTEDIKNYLDENNIKYIKFENDQELIKTIAKLIYKNNVIGWFQGRMEFGPRALGNRSILANPCNPKIQDILNLKVKHREKFRPFAPVIDVEGADKYFECDNPVPIPTDFMLMVYPIKKDKQKLIPAVTHVDGSGRLQTIRKEQNSLYYHIIKEFGNLTKIPILVNTSFNIRGEPIVCTPQDAYRCMMGTGIDYLAIDKFLIKREDNPKDMWDSEKIAKE